MGPAFLVLQGDPAGPGDLVGGPVVPNESGSPAGPVGPGVPGGQHSPVALGAPWAREGQDVSAFLGVRVNPEALAFLVEGPGGLEVLVVP